MGETDYVIRDLTIRKEGVIDFRELYKLMKEWCKQRKYQFLEKEYSDKDSEKGKTLLVRWEFRKKVDDYTREIIDTIIKGSNLKEAKTTRKKVFQGSILISFDAYVEKDYEENWGVNPVSKFIREVFDKIVMNQHFDKVNKELRNETYALFDELKKYIKASS